MSITTYTNRQAIELFQEAARDHVSVNWFDSGPMEYIFNNNKDFLFPAIYLQTLGEELTLGRRISTYALYVLDNSLRASEVDHQEFEWDTRLVDSRDTTFAILGDIVKTVKDANLQNFTMTVTGAIALSDREKEGEVGYSASVTIDAPYRL